MYENFEPCACMTAKEACIVVRQYHEGKFTHILHKHVPAHRLSQDLRLSLLRSLVSYYSRMGGESIVSGHLNDRRGKPSKTNDFNIHVANNSPGVLRTYCGGNTTAWIDQVISPSDFNVAIGKRDSTNHQRSDD